jgi:hypothetical protein
MLTLNNVYSTVLYMQETQGLLIQLDNDFLRAYTVYLYKNRVRHCFSSLILKCNGNGNKNRLKRDIEIF